MGFFRKRFGEKSTYTGLGVVGAVLTFLAGPDGAQAAAPWVALVLGVLQAGLPERSQD